MYKANRGDTTTTVTTTNNENTAYTEREVVELQNNNHDSYVDPSELTSPEAYQVPMRHFKKDDADYYENNPLARRLFQTDKESEYEEQDYDREYINQDVRVENERASYVNQEVFTGSRSLPLTQPSITDDDNDDAYYVNDPSRKRKLKVTFDILPIATPPTKRSTENGDYVNNPRALQQAKDSPDYVNQPKSFSTTSNRAYGVSERADHETHHILVQDAESDKVEEEYVYVETNADNLDDNPEDEYEDMAVFGAQMYVKKARLKELKSKSLH